MGSYLTVDLWTDARENAGNYYKKLLINEIYLYCNIILCFMRIPTKHQESFEFTLKIYTS